MIFRGVKAAINLYMNNYKQGDRLVTNFLALAQNQKDIENNVKVVEKKYRSSRPNLRKQPHT